MTKTFNRKRYEALDSRYKNAYVGTRCCYCGQQADTKDHVPPLAVSYAIGASTLEESGIKLIKVPACRECNTILGNKDLRTVEKRAKYIYEKLKSKYKLLLRIPEWDSEELDELGPNLASMVVKSVEIQQWLERRLQYMEDLYYDVL